MATQLGHVAKQLQRCIRSLDSFTAGQVCMVDCDWDQMTFVTFQVAPNDGLYKGAAFEFKVSFSKNYPHLAPTVNCLTPIYHPNIDPYGEDGNVCVSLLSEWTESNTLEDLIQALLFLMYNPNVDDPLSDLIQGIEETHFEKNVKAIYEEGKNPFSEEAQNEEVEGEEEDYNTTILEDNFFQPAFKEFKETSREEWEKTATERNAEWAKVMEDEAFAEKMNKWEAEEKVRIEEEKKKREEEEQRQREEEERRQKEEEQRRIEEERAKEEKQEEKDTTNNAGASGAPADMDGACAETATQETPTECNTISPYLMSDELEVLQSRETEGSTILDHPEVQVYNLFYKIFQSFKSKARIFLACGRPQDNTDLGTSRTIQESNPPIEHNNVRCPGQSNLQLTDTGATNDMDKLTALVTRCRTTSFSYEGVEGRPEYKRCISC